MSIALAVYMVNLSIDATDMEGRFDPKVNEIESAVELVCEVFLGHRDFLPEHEEPNPEHNTCFLSLDHIIPSNTFELKPICGYMIESKHSFISVNYADPLLTLQPYPPQS